MIDLIYPCKCIFCGRSTEKETVCSECSKELKFVSDEACRNCGHDKESCNCKAGDYAFSELISVFYYTGAAKHMLIRYKFHKKPFLAVYISRYLSELISVKYKGLTFDCVAFVPSSKLKMLLRGYNTAQLIAKDISKKLDIPLVDALGCKFRLISQKRLKKRDRRVKSRGKFYVKNGSLSGKSVLLIDDIKTSGATLSECSYVLKKAGARDVKCATFAITLKK